MRTVLGHGLQHFVQPFDLKHVVSFLFKAHPIAWRVFDRKGHGLQFRGSREIRGHRRSAVVRGCFRLLFRVFARALKNFVALLPTVVLASVVIGLGRQWPPTGSSTGSTAEATIGMRATHRTVPERSRHAVFLRIRTGVVSIHSLVKIVLRQPCLMVRVGRTLDVLRVGVGVVGRMQVWSDGNLTMVLSVAELQCGDGQVPLHVHVHDDGFVGLVGNQVFLQLVRLPGEKGTGEAEGRRRKRKKRGELLLPSIGRKCDWII